MRIVVIRRISQVFFFVLFIWLCIVSTVGTEFWQIRGWPVNLFLELDPLVALGTVLATHTLYSTLILALGTVVLTIILGRFYCGWVCPFGSVHHCAGYLFHRNKGPAEKMNLNRYRRAQSLKYYILAAFCLMALIPLQEGSLILGILDPIPLMTRTVNLALLPIADNTSHITSTLGRFYQGAWPVFLVFFTAVALNLVFPRFYCRILCPLGALFGVLSRFALWRIGKEEQDCVQNPVCERHCEGGCEPHSAIRYPECVLCMNCRDDCANGIIEYRTGPSASGAVPAPAVTRQGFILSLAGGFLAVPAIRLGRETGENWFHKTVRPPGAVEETEFMKRCIRCGQCMRICPTNVIQPAGLDGGLEGLWTPVLNNRIGSSGCQFNCVACGQVCPTAAIRPITLDEKHGLGGFKERGRVRIGTAFIDRNRCLPWSMDKPCIVCQENCPLSPKAIYTDDILATIRDGKRRVTGIGENSIEVDGDGVTGAAYGSGDYFLAHKNRSYRMTSFSGNTITVSNKKLYRTIRPGESVQVQVRLQRPYIDIELCNGCGVCEHECPVSGRRAVRITAEGETRSRNRALLLDYNR